MSDVHRVLVVEDEPLIAEDLAIMLGSLGFAHEVVDNQQQALERFRTEEFCLVLLDLNIKLSPESLRGDAEAGRELLRRMRAISPKHRKDDRPSVPIVVVSAHAREADEAVEAMKDGADDVVQKPFTGSRRLPDKIRSALEASGRRRHELCVVRRWTLDVPALRDRRRYSVRVAGKDASLTPRSLDLLLVLILGKLKGGPVHKIDLGWENAQGFQAMTRLRQEIGACGIPGEDLVVSLHDGHYELAPAVEIGTCDLARLRAIDGKIAGHADALEKALQRRRPAGPVGTS